jgi:hypothetical protein
MWDQGRTEAQRSYILLKSESLTAMKHHNLNPVRASHGLRESIILDYRSQLTTDSTQARLRHPHVMMTTHVGRHK